MIEEKQILEALKKVIDPEIGCNIVDLGLVYEIKINGGQVAVDMTLTAPGCPLVEMIEDEVEKEIKKIKGVKEVKINLVFDPPWTPEKMAPKLRSQMGF